MHITTHRAASLIEPRGINGFGATQTTIRFGEILKGDVEAYILAHRELGFDLTPSQVIRAAVAVFVQSYFDDSVEIAGPAVFAPVPGQAVRSITPYTLSTQTTQLPQGVTGPYAIDNPSPIGIPRPPAFGHGLEEEGVIAETLGEAPNTARQAPKLTSPSTAPDPQTKTRRKPATGVVQGVNPESQEKVLA